MGVGLRLGGLMVVFVTLGVLLDVSYEKSRSCTQDPPAASWAYMPLNDCNLTTVDGTTTTTAFITPQERADAHFALGLLLFVYAGCKWAAYELVLILVCEFRNLDRLPKLKITLDALGAVTDLAALVFIGKSGWQIDVLFWIPSNMEPQIRCLYRSLFEGVIYSTCVVPMYVPYAVCIVTSLAFLLTSVATTAALIGAFRR